jgi:hypothetical protein
MSVEPKRLRIALEGPETARLIVPVNPLSLEAGELTRVDAFVNIPYDDVTQGRAPLHFLIFDGDHVGAEADTVFLAPVAP